MGSSLVMARTFLKIFSKDRQAIFFTLFFPITFMITGQRNKSSNR